MFQVEIRNRSVTEEINKTVLTVNCDNQTPGIDLTRTDLTRTDLTRTDFKTTDLKTTDLNNNDNKTESESEGSYRLNIEIAGARPGPRDTSEDILVSLAR